VAYFKMEGNYLIFGIDGPEGKEPFDTCIDMIEMLCRANVEVMLEFPVNAQGKMSNWATKQIKAPLRWGE
jgi:hypothetical protein